MTAIVLCGATLAIWPIVGVLIGFSLFYVAGMYLNDAYDSEFDRIERPDRPIPAGKIKRTDVFVAAYGLVVLALLVFTATRIIASDAHGSGSIAWLISCLLLITCIVLYNRHHRQNPVSPLILGLCRVMVLVTGSYALTAELPQPLLVAAIVLLCYSLGISYIARQDGATTALQLWPVLLLCAPLIFGFLHTPTSPLILIPVLLHAKLIALAAYLIHRGRPPDAPRAVALLIAGICLLDATLMAPYSTPQWLVAAIGLFFLTVILQRKLRVA